MDKVEFLRGVVKTQDEIVIQAEYIGQMDEDLHQQEDRCGKIQQVEGGQFLHEEFFPAGEDEKKMQEQRREDQKGGFIQPVE